MAAPAAPVDASGGFLVIQYSNGTDTHKSRLHVKPFSLDTFVSGSPEIESGTDDGKHNYAYTPEPAAGAEIGVNDTFAAVAAQMCKYYSAAWSFTLAALYQVVDNVATEVFPTPAPSPVAGTSAIATPVVNRALEMIWNIKTLNGGRARLILIGNGPLGYQVPFNVTSSTGGLGPTEQGVMAYLSGANTGIVAHDGAKFQGAAHVTFAINRRLRRKIGQA